MSEQGVKLFMSLPWFVCVTINIYLLWLQFIYLQTMTKRKSVQIDEDENDES